MTKEINERNIIDNKSYEKYIIILNSKPKSVINYLQQMVALELTVVRIYKKNS